MAASDLLEGERTSFFGFTHEIPISRSTLELVEQLENVVMEHSVGDRTVRRYFETYDTPFIGDANGRRAF
ncbi:hypothetical protein K1T71_007090 [Dendrolimus kikuchii]|uniref:Uncharacterized protein n=1 Tax=Dendrolimus kikuchii TaxID=765133 RepID=A0ACC1CZR7_9NEOP|nr:hypothetical protein K1T71_007090 [Dendrolimus kikuchii]